MRQKGIDGEKLAAEFLIDRGYKIIDKNFHSRFGEIDIIARDQKTIVFVEVKLRSSNFFGTPLEAITHSKLEKMKKTAYYFLTLHGLSDSQYRFDAIQIEGRNSNMKISQVENITL